MYFFPEILSCSVFLFYEWYIVNSVSCSIAHVSDLSLISMQLEIEKENAIISHSRPYPRKRNELDGSIAFDEIGCNRMTK